MGRKDSENKGKVSYRLLDRRRIMDQIRELRLHAEAISVSELDRSARAIAHMGGEVLPVCLDMMRTTDDMLKVRVVSAVLKNLPASEVIPALQDFLLDRSVSDRVKIHLFELLGHFGLDMSQAPLDIILQDPESLPREGMRVILDGVEAGADGMIKFLEELDEAPPGFSEGLLNGAFISNIVEFGGDRAIPLLGVLAQADDSAVASQAISALVKLNTDKARLMLAKVKDKIYSAEVREFFESEVGKPRPLPPPGGADALENARANIEPGPRPPIYKTVISTIDGNGSRAVWIARRARVKGRLETIHLLINSDTGIRDCFGALDVSTREFRAMVKKLGEENRYIEGDYYDYGLLLINDALLQNRRSGKPAPLAFAALKSVLDEDKITPKLYIPKFAGINTDEVESDPLLLEETDSLFELPDFSDWFLDDPEVYDFAEEFTSLGKKRKGDYGQKLSLLYKRFEVKIIRPKVRTLKRRILLQADFLMRSGLDHEAKLALCAGLNLGKAPFDRHPFVMRMMVESVSAALANISKGWDARV